MTLNGTFQITGWDETTEQSFDNGAKQNVAKVKQTYSGDIQGSSEVKYLMNYHPDGTADFVGFEYITGQIDDQQSEITLKHDGKFENGVASSDFIIVSCSSAPELIGKIGQFSSGEAGTANYKVG